MSRAQIISDALQGAWCEAFQSLPAASSSASSSSSALSATATRRHVSETIAQSIDALLTTNALQPSLTVEAAVSSPSHRLLDCLDLTEFATALQLHAKSNADSGIEYDCNSRVENALTFLMFEILYCVLSSVLRFDGHARLFAGVACLLFTGRFGGVDAYVDTTRTQRVCLICKKQWTVDASEPALLGGVKVRAYFFVTCDSFWFVSSQFLVLS